MLQLRQRLGVLEFRGKLEVLQSVKAGLKKWGFESSPEKNENLSKPSNLCPLMEHDSFDAHLVVPNNSQGSMHAGRSSCIWGIMHA